MRGMHDQPPVFGNMLQVVVSDTGIAYPVDNIAKGFCLSGAGAAPFALKQSAGLEQRSVFCHGDNILDSLVFCVDGQGGQ